MPRAGGEKSAWGASERWDGWRGAERGEGRGTGQGRPSPPADNQCRIRGDWVLAYKVNFNPLFSMYFSKSLSASHCNSHVTSANLSSLHKNCFF